MLKKTGLSLLGIIAVVIYRSFVRDKGYHLSAEVMTQLEREPPLGVVSESQYLSEPPLGASGARPLGHAGAH